MSVTLGLMKFRASFLVLRETKRGCPLVPLATLVVDSGVCSIGSCGSRTIWYGWVLPQVLIESATGTGA